MALRTEQGPGDAAERRQRFRRRCLVSALLFTVLLAPLTFDVRTFLPEGEDRLETLIAILGVYRFLWPCLLLGLSVSVGLYLFALVRATREDREREHLDEGRAPSHREPE